MKKSYEIRQIKLKGLVVSFLVLAVLATTAVATNASGFFVTIEAEEGAKYGNVVVANSPEASGSKYIKFGESSNIQRFPGDPNPRVTNKAYWGSTVGGNADPKPRHESPTGKSLSARRTFFGWNHITSGSIVNTARTDHQNNRLPVVSFKTPKWSEFAPGNNQHNATLDKLIRELDALGKPVWLVAYHEPENDPDDGTPAQWRDLQRKVRERIDVIGTKNIAFMPILMDWTWDSRSNRNPNDWWVEGIWDAYIIDAYNERVGNSILDNIGLKNFIPWIEQKNLPFGTAEWGIRTIDGGNFVNISETQYSAATPQLVSEYCTEVSLGRFLKDTTLQQESVAKNSIKNVWEYGFNNNKDWILHSYFDTCINSKSGPWTLGKGQLEAFQEILKNDQRVMRIFDL
jgi:hypothetical protein